MAVELRRRIKGMRGRRDELVHDVIDGLFVFDSGEVPRSIFGIERLGHVKPVEPHLMRIDLLVPESAVVVAGLLPQLREERVERCFIAHVARTVVQREQRTPRTNVVEIVFRLLVGQHAPVGLHDGVVIAQRIVEEIGTVVRLARVHHGQQFESRGVVPLDFAGGDAVERHGRGVAGDLALDHADGKRRGGIVEVSARGAGGGQHAQDRYQQSFHAVLVSWFSFRLWVLRYSAGDMWYCSRKQRLK